MSQAGKTAQETGSGSGEQGVQQGLRKEGVVRIISEELMGRLLSDPNRVKELRVLFHPSIQEPRAILSLSPGEAGAEVKSFFSAQLLPICGPKNQSPAATRTVPLTSMRKHQAALAAERQNHQR